MLDVTVFPVSLNDEFLYSNHSRSYFFLLLSLICVEGFCIVYMFTCSSRSLLVWSLSVDRYCPILARVGNLL